MSEKQCTRCGLVKDQEEFGPGRARCRACRAEETRDYRETHPEDPAKHRERGRRFREANTGKHPAYQRQHKARLRERVFGHYGSVCACCGTAEDLSIDHVNGGGSEHREQVGRGLGSGAG
jgi:hypothetical protein